MYAIETKNLTKKFGELTAVDNVSIRVEEGEIFGLLGPNGAGKTTLISTLVTMRKPTAGKAFVYGFNVLTSPDETRNSIGIVFQDPSLDEELTAYENLEMHAALYGIPKKERERRILELIKTVELEDRLHDIVKTFSGGMRRRLEIARGLLHHPKVLFLDEPTLGLDPQTRKHIWDYILKMKKEHRTTVVLTTHYMDEADTLCDRISIIDHGRIIAGGKSDELKNSLGGDVIVIQASESEKLKPLLENLKWVKEARLHNGNITVGVEAGEKKIPLITNIARERDIEIKSISLHKPTLDDVFLHYTGRTIRSENASVKDSLRIRRRAWRRRG